MESNFNWHKVSDKEKEKIKKNAKKLLDDFSKKLLSVSGEEEHHVSQENPLGTRKKGEPWKTPEEFRDLMLLNAPFVEDDCIVAEKGGWKKNV